MNIKTKYDIGQEVWVFDFFDRPKKVKYNQLVL